MNMIIICSKFKYMIVFLASYYLLYIINQIMPTGVSAYQTSESGPAPKIWYDHN